MSDRASCVCGFYDRDRHHSRVGGGRCLHYAEYKLKQRITELESQLSDARAEIAGLREECTGLRQERRIIETDE